MNKQTAIKNTTNTFDRKYNIKPNVIKINKHNKLEHEIAKFLIVWEKINQNKTCYTETIFSNNKRADIVVAEDMQIIEVLHSETPEQLSDKTKTYPETLDIEYVKTTEIIETFINNNNHLNKYKQGFDILMEYYDSISDEEKIIVDKKLKQLNL